MRRENRVLRGAFLGLMMTAAFLGAAQVPSPEITAPNEVQQGQVYSASTSLSAGQTVQWTVSGATLLSAANLATVQFRAGSSDFVTLKCLVQNASGASVSQRVLPALPFAPRDYWADFNTYLAKYNADITGEVNSGKVDIYYATSYYLHGMIAAAEATGDAPLMGKTLDFIETMIGKAQECSHVATGDHPDPQDGVIYKQWFPLETNGRPKMGASFHAMVPLARAVAVIYANPAFKSSYKTRADQIKDFVHQAIFQYWFDKFTGVYHINLDPNSTEYKTWTWLGGKIDLLPADLGGRASPGFWLGRFSHMARMANWLHQATPNNLYLEYATRVAKGFKRILELNGTHWQWDIGLVNDKPINTINTPDTEHSNTQAAFLVEMYEAGIEMTEGEFYTLAAGGQIIFT